MDLAPQLAFNGQCEQAFEFYARLLGGEIVVMNIFGGNENHKLPPGSVAGPSNKVRYAEIRFSGNVLRGNDVSKEQYHSMRGFNLSLHVHDSSEARRIFSGLAEDGEITTPLSKVDWAELFGMVVDRFGVPWLVLALKA